MIAAITAYLLDMFLSTHFPLYFPLYVLCHSLTDSLSLRLEADEKELFWEKRQYLLASARALPRVLLAAPLACWCCDALPELYALVELWNEPALAEILQLLGPECVAHLHICVCATPDRNCHFKVMN